jgi:hypothetical protein
MPSVNKQQLHLFQMVNAVKAGALSKSKVSKQVADMAESMSQTQIDDYLHLKKKKRSVMN